MRRRFWALALAVAVVAGCRPNYHVNIPPPPASLTPDQRVRAFQNYRQGGSGVEWTTTCSNRGGCVTSSRPVIVLRSGAEIRHAEDLIPILSPTSIAGRAAHEVAAAQRRKARWRRVMWGSLLGGIALLVVANKLDSFELGVAGAAIAIGGPVVGLGGSIANSWDIDRETKTVFANYDQGLAERFAVCVNGLTMVACESNTPGSPPPPAEPDPALRSLRQR